uniref:G-patch domain-containing protein n=1 Tax=Wuchereria bancrofti TaxID=6293 RepID=A0AAF5Q242_WUCBA
MLPFVYSGDGDRCGSYDNERRNDRYRRSNSRGRSRSRSWSRDRRRRVRYSRSRSSGRSRSRSRSRTRSCSRSSHDRSPRLDFDRRRRSIDRDREEPREFSSALPYLSSMQAQSQTDKYASHTALYGQPHYKIVMKMLPTDSQRDALMALTARQGFRVKDIRIIHKGPDRCFGFVEFGDVNSAQAWMEYNKGTLLLDDGRPVKLEYSRYDSLDGRSSGLSGSGDWMCAKCTIKNFKNRGACFKCNLTRMESDGLTRKGYAAIGVAKCDTLLLREIPLNCTEAKIQAEMNRISSLDVLRVHIAESGLYAYVQMRSADDAERIMLTLNKIPLLIDGCAVMVTYSRLPLNTVLSTTAATESMQKTAERINQMPAFRPTAGPSGNAGVEAAQLAIAKAQLIRQMTNSMITTGDTVPPIYSAAATAIPPILNRPPPPLPHETNFVVTDYFKDETSADRNFVCVDDITIQDSQGILSGGGVQGSSASYTGPQIKGAADLGFVETPWGRYKRYRAPNPTIYQFEPSSGLYYDPTTGLYYDSNSQYYWDANVQKWNCWNAAYQTYVPCDLMSRQTGADQVVTNNESKNETIEKNTEAVKEEPKKEPQKTAKDIAREMARWAKKQSKVLLAVKAPPKLETTSPLVTAAKPKTTAVEPTADLTYKMLEKTSNPFGSFSDDDEEEEIPPAAKIAAVGVGRVALNSKSGNRLMQHAVDLLPPSVGDPVVPPIKTTQSDENFVDIEKKYCILCRRKFASLEILMKHVRMSDLHKKNLEAHLLQASLDDSASLSMPSVSTAQGISSCSLVPQQYRDRAKERRNLFGLDPSGFTSDSVEVGTDYAVRSSDIPIDDTNIGNKLLKSMGWQEGTGIGKNNQGIITPIATEMRVEGAGLGAAGSRVLHGANASRRERARTSMMSRFQDLQ